MDEDECSDRSLVFNINKALKYDAQKRILTSHWQTFSISRTNIGGAYLKNDDALSARYLLANNSVNYIQGKYRAKCKGGKVITSHVSLEYEWYDEIDAHNFKEAYNANSVHSFVELLSINPIEIVEVILGDWVGDKVLGGAYYVIVKGHYSRNKE